MDENNTNQSAENITETTREPIYRCDISMDRAFFGDLCFLSYQKFRKRFLLLLCFSIFEVIANIWIKNGFFAIISMVLSLMMLMICIVLEKGSKLSYERTLLSLGKEAVLHTELFEDTIVSNAEEGKREYSYDQITNFFETPTLLLLHLKHQLYIAIGKNTLNTSADEVKSFLTEKCRLVKKKTFMDCSHDRKWSFLFLGASLVCSFLGMIITFC